MADNDTRLDQVEAQPMRSLSSIFTDSWSVTQFHPESLSTYAGGLMLDETRRGLRGLATLSLLILAAEALLYARLGLPGMYLYSSGLLALFAAHILFISGSIRDLPTLHLLGMTLLVVSGMAFVLLAHKTGAFSIALFATVALLFMVIPMVPWGLREASVTAGLVYGMFTASTWSAATQFESSTLITLQFIMLGASGVSLALVARNVRVRRRDINTRFELEEAHKKILILSNKDPLTGAWNRRYLKGEFAARLEEWRIKGRTFHFAFIDIDDFKPINDSFGHDYGDEVLKGVAGSFESVLGDTGCLVRMGGDEFAILFADQDPVGVMQDGLERIKDHNGGIGPHNGCVRLSIGMVSVAPSVSPSQETVYKEADIALYAAKERKRETTELLNLERRYLEESSVTVVDLDKRRSGSGIP